MAFSKTSVTLRPFKFSGYSHFFRKRPFFSRWKKKAWDYFIKPFYLENFRIPELHQDDSWFMSFHGSCHFILIQAKTTKQAKHISLWRRHGNHTSGRGIFVGRVFFQPTDWCVNFWTNWLVLQFFGLFFNLQTSWNKSLGVNNKPFLGGNGLWFEIHNQTKLQQTLTENPNNLESVKLREKNSPTTDQAIGNLKRFISWTLVAPFVRSGLNSHYFDIVGDGKLNPIVGVYRAPL